MNTILSSILLIYYVYYCKKILNHWFKNVQKNFTFLKQNNDVFHTGKIFYNKPFRTQCNKVFFLINVYTYVLHDTRTIFSLIILYHISDYCLVMIMNNLMV